MGEEEALEAEEVPTPQEEEDEEAGEEGLEGKEHLRDAVDGSLRLKRMLSQDSADGDTKRRKLTGSDVVINQLLTKWALATCPMSKHVLSNLSETELKEMAATQYSPDKFHQRHTPAEQLMRFSNEMRERKGIGGGPVDIVSTFKFRFKLDLEADKKLRALTHKELRYVIENFVMDEDLDEAIEAAKGSDPENPNKTEAAGPERPGVLAMGRFARLELIDPLADAAVFGDANLTFSLNLARHRKSLGHVGRVIATTFEELDTLRERYTEIDDSVKELEDHYAEVYHGVDCTRIALDPRFNMLQEALGAVYYNFPHSGAVGGFFDGHPVVNWRHENLMRLFFRALRSFVNPGGSVKVASNMGAVGVRYSYIVGSAIENEFLHEQTMPFKDWHLHRYGRSYGDKRDAYKRPDAKQNESYNAQAGDKDMVYCFTYKPSGEQLPQQTVRIPPSLKIISACTDGPFKNLMGPAKDNLAKQLHTRFVTEISGTHVG